MNRMDEKCIIAAILMRIITLNMNGIRSATTKGFFP